MNNPFTRRHLVLIAGAIAFTAVSAGRPAAATPVVFPNTALDLSALAATDGITMTTPDPLLSPPVAKAQALQIAGANASDSGPANAVISAVLADVTDANQEPTFYCVCWVVAMTPGTLPSVGPSLKKPALSRWIRSPEGKQPLAETYKLEFIDASSGAWLWEAAGAPAGT